jgi:hypothetical protein
MAQFLDGFSDANDGRLINYFLSNKMYVLTIDKIIFCEYRTVTFIAYSVTKRELR